MWKEWSKTRKLEDEEAYKQVCRGYHYKLEYTKKNYTRKLRNFAFMYNIIGKVKKIVYLIMEFLRKT